MLLALASLLGACGPSVASPTPEPSAVPTATVEPSADFVPALVDRTLLEILPDTVDGLEVAASSDGEAAGLGDPMLARVSVAFASAFAAAGDDFVFAVVVRLRPGLLDAGSFRDWRDSFDEGACEQAGGVVGHAETEIGGRTVYIGTCGGGLRTYHVWLEGSAVLISASAVGERRLGERLVENLRP
jgi:hypothetical protein